MMVTLSSICNLTKQNMLLAFSTLLVGLTEKFQRYLEILEIYYIWKILSSFFYINETDQSFMLLSQISYDCIGGFPLILCLPFWSTLPSTQNGKETK